MEKILQIFISTIIALIPVFQASADVAIPQNHEGTADNPLVDIKGSIKTRLELFNSAMLQKKFLVTTFLYADGTEQQEEIAMNDKITPSDFVGYSVMSLRLAAACDFTQIKKSKSNITVSKDGLTGEIVITGPDNIEDYDIPLDGPYGEAYGFLPNIEDMELYIVHHSENNIGSDDCAYFPVSDDYERYRIPFCGIYLYGCCKNEISGRYDYVVRSDMSFISDLVNINAPWYMTTTDHTAPDVTWDAKITKLGQVYGYMETLEIESQVTVVRNGVTVRYSNSRLIHIPYPKSDEGKAIVSQLGYVVP